MRTPENIDGYTPLICAAERGHSKCVELLISNAADVNIYDESGKTAIVYASKNRHMKCVDILEQAGADVNEPDEEEPPLIKVYYA